MKKLLLFFIALFCSLAATHQTHAQVISTEGKEFYAGFMQINPGTGTNLLKLIISSRLGAEGTISMPANVGFATEDFLVGSNNTTTKEYSVIYAANGSGNIQNNVFYIKSNTNDISVTAVYSSPNRTEASAVLPITSLGSSPEYIINSNTGNGIHEFLVVGTADATTLEITPPNNAPFNVTLNRGQLVQYQLGNPTGTRIKATGTCKAFAVFAGTNATLVSCINGTAGINSSQHTYEQQYPIQTWGKDYILTPYKGLEGYHYRIVAKEDNTTVTINDGVNPAINVALNSTEFDLRLSPTANAVLCVNADKPISLSTTTPNSNCNNNGQEFTGNKADASLLLLNPLNQTTNQTTFNTMAMAAATGRHFVNVIMKTDDVADLRMASKNNSTLGTTIPADYPSAGTQLTTLFTPITHCAGYSFAQLPISNNGGATETTTLAAVNNKQFIAFAYGYSGVDVYAYSVGASFENQQYNFTATPQLSCGAPQTINFVGTGINVINYKYNFGDGSPEVTGQNQTHTYTAVGEYEVTMTVTTIGGCGEESVKKTVKIYDITTPISIGTNQTVCIGANLVLTAPAGPDQTYQWYKDGAIIPAATNQTYTVPTVAAGTATYRVNVIKGLTCTVQSNTINVTVSAPPVATLSPTTGGFCTGGTILLTATPNPLWTYKFKLNGIDIVPSGGLGVNTYSATLVGNYTCEVTNEFGCSVLTNTSAITGPPLILPTIQGAGSKTYFCAGGGLLLSATVTPTDTYTYQWQREIAGVFTNIVGATNATYNATIAGKYQVIATSTNSLCSGTSPEFTVTEEPNPIAVANANKLIFCQEETLLLTTTTAPAGQTYTYEWYRDNVLISNQQNPSFTMFTVGTFLYKVKITNTTTQCTTTSPEISIVVNPMPNTNVTFTGALVLCQGETKVLTAQDAPAGQTYSYQWRNNGVDIVGETNKIFTANSTGNYTVKITTDKNCEKISLPINITVNPIPIATISATQTTFCSAETTTLSTVPVTAGQTWSYAWKRNGVVIAGETNATLTTNISGDYTVAITNQFNCTVETATPTVIVVNPSPDATITATPLVLCAGENTVIQTVPVPMGQTWTYEWTRNGTLIAGENGATLTVTTTGDYKVKITTGFGCEMETATALTITVNPLPVVTISGLNVGYCSNDVAIDLTGKGSPAGGVFSLSKNGGAFNVVTSIDIPTISFGTYELRYVYTNPLTNCTNAATFNFAINEVIPVAITNLNDKYCINDAPIVLTGNGVGGTAQFFINGIPATTFDPTALGVLGLTHTVRYVYTYGTGCEETAEKIVTVNQLPTVAITGLKDQYCLNGTPENLVATTTPAGGTGIFKINGVTVTSVPAQFNPTNVGTGNHLVEFLYTDLNGCENTTSKNVEVLAPTALTFNALATKYCSNVADITLAATPAGGQFFVNDVLETRFRPQFLGAGVHKVEYVFTSPGIAGCTDKITQAVTVVAPTKIFYATPIRKDYCVSDADFLLVPTPATATVTIDGVPAPAGAAPNTYIFSPSTLGARATPYIVKTVFTDANLCLDELISEVFVNPLPVLTMTGVNAEYCLNDAGFTPIVNPTGGVFRVNGVVRSTPLLPRTLGAGTHTLRYTYADAKSCQSFIERTFVIKPLPSPKITTTFKPVFCNTEAAISVNATPLGGTFIINGNIAGINVAPNTVTFNPNSIGVSPRVTIIYSYTDPLTNCTNADTTFTQIIAPPAIPTLANVTTCKSAGNVRLNAFVATHDTNISYVWTNKATGEVLATTATLIVTQSGTYRVQITDARACSPVFAESKVEINPNPVVDLGANRNICGNVGITLDADPNGNNTGNFKYLWNTGATTQKITINSDTIRGARAYWVRVTDENFTSKCSSADTVLLFFNDVPVVDLGKDRSICNPQDVPYTLVGQDISHANMGVTYKWTNPFAANPSATLATTPNYNITEPGTYTLTVTSTKGCSKSDSVTILFDADPDLKILGANEYAGICQVRDTLYVQATNILNYDVTWSGPGIVSTSADKLSIVVEKSGRYFVRAADKTKTTKCDAVLFVDVFIADFPAVQIKPLSPTKRIIACQDSVVTLNASDTSHRATFKYEWRLVGSNNIIATTPQLPITQSIVGNFDPVRYWVRVSPPSGCVSGDTVTVQFQPKPVAKIDENYPKQICFGESFTLRASGGTNFKWTTTDPGQGTIPNNANVVIKPSKAGTYTYTIEVTTPTSTVCKSDRVSVTVIVNPPMIAKIPNQDVKLCEDSSIELDGFDPLHPLSVRYEWKNVATGVVVGRSSKQKFDFATLLPRPSYNTEQYEFSVTDGITGCVAKDIMKITFLRKAKPIIDRIAIPIIDRKVPIQICLGDRVELVATQGGTYRWSTGSKFDTTVIIPKEIGLYTYWVAAKFDNDCTEGTDTIRVRVNPLPVAVANADKNLKICAGNSVTLEASGGVRYEWRHGDKTAKTTVSPKKDTWYYVTVFNESGCKSTDEVLVRVTPIKELPPRIVLCDNDRTQLDATNPDPEPATYLWNNGDQRPIIPIFRAGIYTVKVKIRDCEYTQTTEVIYRSRPRIDLTADTLLCFARPAEIAAPPYRSAIHTIEAKLLNREAGEIYYYDWRLKGATDLIVGGVGIVEANNIVPLPLNISGADTSYVVRIRAGSTNCETYDTIRVNFNCEGRIKIPTAFSPNDDKLNDTFAPVTSDLTGIMIQVYHKWGDLIFEKFVDPKKNMNKEIWDGVFDEKDGWNGTFGGSPVPVDSYQYVIVYWYKDRKGFAVRRSVTGSIAVIREFTR
jgi:PKD repeat protein